MSRIVPAILTDDTKTLDKMVRQVETFTDFFQLDIMDGEFVPSRSINAGDVAALKTKLNWEAHLMVTDPQQYLEGFRKAGAKRVVFHYESGDYPLDVISQAKSIGLECGMAINPETDIEDIMPFVDRIDSVLFLSVTPGFYGSKFIPEVLDKIRQFRKLCPCVETGIDGGVKENNIATIASTGVDFICVGSAIFMQDNPAESFQRLSALAEESLPSF